MPIHRVTCPECRTVLKSRRRIPRGKLLTCPKCEVLFAAPAPAMEVVDEVEVVEDDDIVEDVEVIDDEPPPRPRPKAKQPEEVQSIAGKPFPPAFPDAVRSKPKTPPKRPKPKPSEEVESIAGKPLPPPLPNTFLSRAKTTTEEAGFEVVEDEAEDEGDRPRRSKSKRRKPLTMRQIVGLTAAGVGLIFFTIFTAWWFLHGSGVESDPLAYVPPDAHVVAGVKLGAILKAAPSLDPKLSALLAASPFASSKAETGLEFRELFDETFAGFRFGPTGNTHTIVAKTSSSFDKVKVGRLFPGSTPATLDGYSYFKVSQPGLTAVYLPTNRLIVMAEAPDPILDAVFGGEAKKGGSSSEASELMQKIAGNQVWAVCAVQRLDPQVRQQVVAGLVSSMPGAPEGTDPANLLDQCRALAFWGSIDGGQIDLHYGLRFGDDAQAKAAAVALEAGAKKQGDTVAAQALMMAFPSLKALNEEQQRTMKFSTDGALAEVSVQISLATLEAVIGDAGRIAAAMGAAAGQPQKPPPKEPPAPGRRRGGKG